MFQSQPICILQAGTTVDGRVIEQNIIDEIAESYNPRSIPRGSTKNTSTLAKNSVRYSRWKSVATNCLRC